MSTLNIDSTLYRARITLGDLIVPPYPGGELYALDELPDYYPANQAAEVIRAKVVLKLGIHHTDASSVQVAELLTHAQLHERGFLLEIEAPLGCPTYITPERMSYMFDDPRSVQMWSQLHAGVMLNQVSENVLFRAVVYQLNDVGVARKWLVLLGLPFVYRGDDCDAVFDRLPAMLANCWGVDTALTCSRCSYSTNVAAAHSSLASRWRTCGSTEKAHCLTCNSGRMQRRITT